MSLKYKNIYVYCLSNAVTGGPETLHSIVDVINNYGGNAYIVYDKSKSKIPEPYTIYKIKQTEKVEDSSENLLIVSEVSTDFLFEFKKINKCVVFLSLEYYLNTRVSNKIKNFLMKNKIPFICAPLLYPFAYLLRRQKYINFRKINFADPNLIITCNGEVNKQYLIENKNVDCSRIGYICGPINTEFINNVKSVKKENIVCFNPKKGFKFTKKIIELYKEKFNNAVFIPIENMVPVQVHDLLLKSKVYIDFGNHPGPERIPREAVVSYCNIITSKNGSAAFYDDVPIPDKYKFEDKDENLEEICEVINQFIVEYEQYNSDFQEFRNKVLNQRNVFEKNVKSYFLQEVN